MEYGMERFSHCIGILIGNSIAYINWDYINPILMWIAIPSQISLGLPTHDDNQHARASFTYCDT